MVTPARAPASSSAPEKRKRVSCSTSAVTTGASCSSVKPACEAEPDWTSTRRTCPSGQPNPATSRSAVPRGVISKTSQSSTASVAATVSATRSITASRSCSSSAKRPSAATAACWRAWRSIASCATRSAVMSWTCA